MHKDGLIPPLHEDGQTQVYIAGPMTGIKDFNFPAFDNAAMWISSMGYKVWNPAEEDRKADFDPTKGFTQEDLLACIRRDVDIIVDHADMLFVLDGWERSQGANAEVMLAHWKKIPVFSFPFLERIPNPVRTLS